MCSGLLSKLDSMFQSAAPQLKVSETVLCNIVKVLSGDPEALTDLILIRCYGEDWL